MNSKTLVFFVTTILSASALFAEPRVDQSAVTLEQDSQSRLVTVGYELTGEPAVITVDFQTNTLANAAGDWVSIGDVNFTNVIGGVNQVVQPGVRTITWQPDKSWPDQRINDGRVRAVVKAWATNAPPDYCVVCLLSDADIQTRQETDVTFNPIRRRYFVSSNAVPGGVQDRMYKTDYLLLRKCPAAGVVWRMGEAGSTSATTYPHKVRLTRDYYIGIYEVTYGQYKGIFGSAPTAWSSDNAEGENKEIHPAMYVYWTDLRGNATSYPWPDANTNANHSVAATSFFGKLRTLSGIASFDLPTEAQWEYACRAGTGTDYANGGNVTDMGWTKSNSAKGVTVDAYSIYAASMHTVGLKQPNNWGLYDMHGNVGEHCLDWFADYDAEAADNGDIAEDPVGAATGTSKIVRGGDAEAVNSYAKSSSRTGRNTNGQYPSLNFYSSRVYVGFRVVCDAVAK